MTGFNPVTLDSWLLRPGDVMYLGLFTYGIISEIVPHLRPGSSSRGKMQRALQLDVEGLLKIRSKFLLSSSPPTLTRWRRANTRISGPVEWVPTATCSGQSTAHRTMASLDVQSPSTSTKKWTHCSMVLARSSTRQTDRDVVEAATASDELHRGDPARHRADLLGFQQDRQWSVLSRRHSGPVSVRHVCQ